MKYHSRLQQIRRYSERIKMIKLNQLIMSQPELYQQIRREAEEEMKQQEEGGDIDEDEEMEMEDDFDIAQYIHSMPSSLKQEFKDSNPQLPQIFFMTAKEKKQYFNNINNKFKKHLQSAPRRKSKNKRKISFKPSFDVRGFNQHQKVTAVKKGQQVHQTYQPGIHFS